jgi:uncharacterized membrane protein
MKAKPSHPGQNRYDLTRFLFQNSIFIFSSFFVLALMAFWSSYYGHLLNEPELVIHFHGISMILWCLMLISQSLLIRLKKQKLHKLIGKFSYVLAPVIILSGFSIAHYTVKQTSSEYYVYDYLVALMFLAVIAFGVLYGLAIYNRRKPAIHGRYMLTTIFPLFTPVTDRLTYKYLPALLELAPVQHGIRMVPATGFAFANLLIIILIVWDWRANRQFNVFPIALGILLVYHAMVLHFYQYPWWQALSGWLMKLPLS